jgi:hypothetical protein
MEDSVPAEINTSKNANVSLAINSENITVNSAIKKSSILTAKLAKMKRGKSYLTTFRTSFTKLAFKTSFTKAL